MASIEGNISIIIATKRNPTYNQITNNIFRMQTKPMKTVLKKQKLYPNSQMITLQRHTAIAFNVGKLQEK